MGWWTEHVVPRIVDLSLSQPPVAEQRGMVCEGLRGRVLEIGFGSGLNLEHLPAEVAALDAVEPSYVAWSRSASRRGQSRRSGVPVERIGLDGRRVDAPDRSYDAALCTFSLCTILDPGAALAEVVRLLVPGGSLHFLEHGLAPDAGVVTWQRRLEPAQRRFVGGCHLTRDPVALVEAAGMRTIGVRQFYLAPGPGRPFGYLTRGRADTAD